MLQFCVSFGLLFAVAFAAPLVPYSYLHTPTFNTAVVHSERFNNAFPYNSIQSHAYIPTTQPIVYYYYTYPTYTYDFSPPVQPGVVNAIPSYPFIPNYPSGFPQGGGVGGGPNRPPIEVEDPADNLPVDEIKQQNGNNNKNENDDDDTVTIESL